MFSMREKMIFNYVFLGLVTISMATPHESLWHKFKLDHNKSYKNPEEELHRFQIFRSNLKKIENNMEKFRHGEISFELGITKFADMERGKLSLNDAPSDTRGPPPVVLSHEKIDIPERMDWRKSIPMPRVYDQGNCNASSYIAVAGLIQTQRYIHQKIDEPVSVQNMMDCGYNFYNFGCYEGSVRNNLGFITNTGLPAASNYPAYDAELNDCRNSTGKLAVEVGQMTYYLIDESEIEMAKIVATKGPIAISVVDQNPRLYTGGVMNDPECTSTDYIDYAQYELLVGYDTTEDGQEYWIVQFSYGEDWGENGYARIARNVDMCSISRYPYYVSFEQ